MLLAAAGGNRQNAFVPNGNTNAWGDNWLEYSGAWQAAAAAAAASRICTCQANSSHCVAHRVAR
jgi:hypothetical protein